MLFGVVFPFAPLLMGIQMGPARLARLGLSLFDLLLSLMLGALSGTLIHFATRKDRAHPPQVIIITAGFLLLSTAVSVALGLSPLLLNMTAGTLFVNLSRRSESVFRTLEPLTPPLYALFFVLAGAKFEPLALLSGPLVVYGVIYIGSRVVGTVFGVRGAGRLVGAPPGIRKNLGACLIPQAGVALGLVLLMEGAPVLGQLPATETAAMLQAVNIVLMAIFVKEIAGPSIVALALRRGVLQTGRGFVGQRPT